MYRGKNGDKTITRRDINRLLRKNATFCTEDGKRVHLSERNMDVLINVFINIIYDCLRTGTKWRIKSFGSFQRSQLPPKKIKTSMNYCEGERIIPPRWSFDFTPLGELKKLKKEMDKIEASAYDPKTYETVEQKRARKRLKKEKTLKAIAEGK